ncbi:carbonic anhydrase 4-like [Genypterus blacodes]|uniref:carbonic anhydrase 4-like n=1 Tax=Genypterus blacodes TaxID=154954 RepID=UPI003F7573E4
MLHRCLTDRAAAASKMKCVQVVFALCVLLRGGQCASNAVEWCYDQPTCNQATWPTIAAQYCNGSRQSPINIISADATEDGNLTAFTFTNFDNKAGMTKIENTGKTVKVVLADGIGFSGGGLSEPYVSFQFHLHWGNGSTVPGSEHAIDGIRYAMAVHVVSIKSSYNKNNTLGFADSEGFSALGFLVDALPDNATTSPAAWSTLASYLKNITEKGQYANITDSLSLDDLFVGVDRTRFYRYLGSLTTPLCQEAVVWTVFKDPIKVSKEVIDLFSSSVRVGNASSAYMVNVFRDVQKAQPVSTQRAATSTTSASIRTCSSLSLGLVMLALALVMSRH